MYNYDAQRVNLFSDKGQRIFLEIRDRVHRLLKEAGAVNMSCAVKGITADDWQKMACVDRLVEIGEIQEIRRDCGIGHRVFVLQGE